MMKSIVVALDGSSSSVNARKTAIEVAKRTGASLVGIGVLDTPWITEARATPVGAGSYQTHRNETLIAEGREAIRDRIDAFRAEVAEAGLECMAIGAEGDPVVQLDAEADRHDLIVIGRETNFHGGENHHIGGTVEKLLENNPRPLIVAPETDFSKANDEVVVVAFDGDVTSSRAMHMFLLLGLAKGREVHVVSVDADSDKANATADRGAALFRSHGYAALANGVASKGKVSDAVLGAISSVGAGRLVMGAHGHEGRLRRMFVGSTTTRLLTASPVPVFVHH
jgi:nucleotide-binding universal stress UspA family protein